MQSIPAASAVDIQEAQEQRSRRRAQLRETEDAQLATTQLTHTERKSAGAPVPASSSSAALPLSIAQRCYTDALHCLYKFLKLKDLLPAIQTCRYWRDAAYQEKRRAEKFKLSKYLLPWILHSPLRHHIMIASVTKGEHWTACDLCMLRDLTLKELDVSLDASSWNKTGSLASSSGKRGAAAVAYISQRLPASLTRLSVTFKNMGDTLTLAACRVIVDVSCALANLVELCFDFHLLSASSCIQLQLDSLLSLPMLTKLELRAQILSASQLDVLSRLRVTTLHLTGEISPWKLTKLSANELAHSLVTLWFKSACLDADQLRALSGFPSMKSLDAEGFLLESLPLLSSLLSLTCLNLFILDDGLLTPAALVVPHLHSCKHLTQLTLRWCSFSATELADLAGLSLVALTLIGSQLPSSLSALSKCKSLTELQLQSCPRLWWLHLASLGSVASLRTLRADLSSHEMRLAQVLLQPKLPQLTILKINAIHFHQESSEE
jgi:hypothetical protein